MPPSPRYYHLICWLLVLHLLVLLSLSLSAGRFFQLRATAAAAAARAPLGATLGAHGCGLAGPLERPLERTPSLRAAQRDSAAFARESRQSPRPWSLSFLPVCEQFPLEPLEKKTSAKTPESSPVDLYPFQDPVPKNITSRTVSTSDKGALVQKPVCEIQTRSSVMNRYKLSGSNPMS